MAACGAYGNEEKAQYKSRDDTAQVTEDQTTCACACGKVMIEFLMPKSLATAQDVCKECWSARKYAKNQDGFEGDKDNLRVQTWVYFGNDIEILKGDDYVQFSVLKEGSDFIRMYAKCCHTILMGYSQKFQGWEGKRIAYLYQEKLFKSPNKIKEPSARLWKNDMKTADLKKVKPAVNNKKWFLFGGKSGKKQAPAFDYQRTLHAIAVLDAKFKNIDPEPTTKGITFMDLMEKQTEGYGPDLWKA